MSQQKYKNKNCGRLSLITSKSNDSSKLSEYMVLWTIAQVPDRQIKKKEKQTVEGVAFSGKKVIKEKTIQ